MGRARFHRFDDKTKTGQNRVLLFLTKLDGIKREQVNRDLDPKLLVAFVEAPGDGSFVALGDVAQNVSFLKNLRDSFVLFFYSTRVVGFLLSRFSLKTSVSS